MKFSEKIRELRIKNGLSQEELSERLGVSRQTVSKWEAGNTFPEIEKLIALSDFYQVSIDYLLKDKQVNTNFPDNLEKTVIQFLGSANKMADISRQLVDIMEDGIIDAGEKLQMENIIHTMDKISENIEKIKKAIDYTCSNCDNLSKTKEDNE